MAEVKLTTEQIEASLSPLKSKLQVIQQDFSVLTNTLSQLLSQSSYTQSNIREKQSQIIFRSEFLDLLKQDSFDKTCKLTQAKCNLHMAIEQSEKIISDTFHLTQQKTIYLAKESN